MWRGCLCRERPGNTPAIIHELELETRAGSPLSVPGDLLDLLSLELPDEQIGRGRRKMKDEKSRRG
ncbi:MAG: hypothetical protein KJ638_13695 [Chloroflexi bacterium]|nr:hypothetical protein [Chloroflexota bacterium]